MKIDRNYLKPAAIGAVLYFLLSLIYRTIHIDDYWLGEYAYWFSKMNYVKSEFFRGYESYETKLLVYHKLFIVLGGVLIKLFGFKVYILKSVSLFFLAISVWLVWLLIKDWKDIQHRSTLFLIYVILCFSEPHIFEYGFVFRPEIMLMCCGLCAFYFLNKGIEKSNNYYFILCGIFSGICFLTHLNGFAFLLAGGLVLVVRKRILPILYYMFSALVISLLYFWDIHSAADWMLFLKQFKNDPALDESDFKISTYFYHLIKEHERFFHSPSEIFISILFILSFIYNYSYLRRSKNKFTIYYAVVIVGMAIFCYGKTAKYLLVYMPFICLVVALAFYRLWEEIQVKNKLGKILPFFLLAFLVSSIIVNFLKFNLDTISSIFIRRNEQALVEKNLHMPEGIHILGSMRYVYLFQGKYRLQSLTLYNLFRERPKYYKNNFNFLALAAAYGNEYIFLDREYIDRLKLSDKDIFLSNYRFLYRKNDLWVLKNKNK